HLAVGDLDVDLPRCRIVAPEVGGAHTRRHGRGVGVRRGDSPVFVGDRPRRVGLHGDVVAVGPGVAGRTVPDDVPLAAGRRRGRLANEHREGELVDARTEVRLGNVRRVNVHTRIG